jgi:preprotein translocase subunit SecE
MLETVQSFFSDVVAELKKVSWPSRKQTINSTVVVITLMIVLGVFLAIIDTTLAKIVSLIIG